MQLLQLARFNAEAKIELVNVDINSERYIAVSHAWDAVRWQRIPSFSKDLLVSDHKATFIESTLPSLVGDTPFWLDSICVDQSSETAKKAIIQSIPAIYRQAVKTIAVRDGDGFQDCCRDAIGTFESWDNEGIGKWVIHLQKEHSGSELPETYLRRLWTLTELFLSDDIHFTGCRDRGGKKVHDDYSFLWVASRMKDDLNTLGRCWLQRGLDGNSASYEDFVRAFLNGDTVSRGKGNGTFDCIDDYKLRKLFQNSSRSATYPSDYVLAIFPQFRWYSIPAGVENMVFRDLFKDCYRQALRKGHGFLTPFTESMMSANCPQSRAWDASFDVPEPTCFGDFLKLIGEPLKSADSIQGHVASAVKLSLPSYQLDFSSTLEVIEINARKFRASWNESHIGGELSKYGSWADEEPDNKSLYEEAKQNRASFVEAAFGWYVDEANNRLEQTWILSQTRIILDSAFVACSGTHGGEGLFAYQSSYETVKDWLLRDRPWGYREALLLMAAMIGCRVPLSAYEWTKARFYPVSITFARSKMVLGLLSHQHGNSLKARGRFKYVRKGIPAWPGFRTFQAFWTRANWSMVVERGYKNEGSKGRSLVLVDPWTKVPVGLVPDFNSLVEHDDAFVENIMELYTVTEKISENSVRAATIDIRDLDMYGDGNLLNALF